MLSWTYFLTVWISLYSKVFDYRSRLHTALGVYFLQQLQHSLAHGVSMKQAVKDAIAYTCFVAQKSWSSDPNNDPLRCAVSVSMSQLPDEASKPTANSESLVISKQQEPVLKDHDNIVLVKNLQLDTGTTHISATTIVRTATEKCV